MELLRAQFGDGPRYHKHGLGLHVIFLLMPRPERPTVRWFATAIHACGSCDHIDGDMPDTCFMLQPLEVCKSSGVLSLHMQARRSQGCHEQQGAGSRIVLVHQRIRCWM